MCMACNMGFGRHRTFQFDAGNWLDTGPIIMASIGRVGLSVGLRRVRPWLKPQRHHFSGEMVALNLEGSHTFKAPSKSGIMWGIFHLVWEHDPKGARY